MTKWPVQKHTEHHKTRSKQRRNRHKEVTFFVFFDFSDFYFQFKECFESVWILKSLFCVSVHFAQNLRKHIIG